MSDMPRRRLSVVVDCLFRTTITAARCASPRSLSFHSARMPRRSTRVSSAPAWTQGEPVQALVQLSRRTAKKTTAARDDDFLDDVAASTSRAARKRKEKVVGEDEYLGDEGRSASRLSTRPGRRGDSGDEVEGRASKKTKTAALSERDQRPDDGLLSMPSRRVVVQPSRKQKPRRAATKLDLFLGDNAVEKPPKSRNATGQTFPPRLESSRASKKRQADVSRDSSDAAQAKASSQAKKSAPVHKKVAQANVRRGRPTRPSDEPRVADKPSTKARAISKRIPSPRRKGKEARRDVSPKRLRRLRADPFLATPPRPRSVKLPSTQARRRHGTPDAPLQPQRRLAPATAPVESVMAVAKESAGEGASSSAPVAAKAGVPPVADKAGKLVTIDSASKGAERSDTDKHTAIIARMQKLFKSSCADMDRMASLNLHLEELTRVVEFGVEADELTRHDEEVDAIEQGIQLLSESAADSANEGNSLFGELPLELVKNAWWDMKDLALALRRRDDLDKATKQLSKRIRVALEATRLHASQAVTAQAGLAHTDKRPEAPQPPPQDAERAMADTLPKTSTEERVVPQSVTGPADNETSNARAVPLAAAGQSALADEERLRLQQAERERQQRLERGRLRHMERQRQAQDQSSVSSDKPVAKQSVAAATAAIMVTTAKASSISLLDKNQGVPPRALPKIYNQQAMITPSAQRRGLSTKTPFTDEDKRNIVNHLSVTQCLHNGNKVAKELEVRFGRHSWQAYQTHLSDNLNRGKAYATAIRAKQMELGSDGIQAERARLLREEPAAMLGGSMASRVLESQAAGTPPSVSASGTPPQSVSAGG